MDSSQPCDDDSPPPTPTPTQHPNQPTVQVPAGTFLPSSSSLPLRTASSTPISAPGLFSPSPSRHLPTSVSESNTPIQSTGSPYLHPLQSHRVRETHKALIDSDNITGRKSINQYEVIEEIGRGMHGKVKLARNTETGENVAIKIIPRFSKKRRLGRVTAMSPQDKTKKEIAILKKMRHPNVVALLEVIDDPELRKIYMVLEHVELGEIVWRKKGLPHICQFERRRVEREIQGEAPTLEEDQYNRMMERRQALKEIKRAKMARHFPGPSDYWSVEHGAADELSSSAGRWSRVSSRDDMALSDPPSSRPTSRRSSLAPSRSVSVRSTGRPPTELDDGVDWTEDLQTPMPRSNASVVADASPPAASPHDGFRVRSPSMADSIISHMSSVDYNPRAHDPFGEDFSFVPCFTLDQARSTFRDTVLGLEYLHYQGVVHRDIKPANLLWTREHRVKISDFGVSYFGRPIRDGELLDETVSESEAKDFDDDLELAKTVGTPAFFAPELCYTDVDKDEQPRVSEQIDVWSLGVTLYCLVYARIPFLAEDEFQMFRKIATEDVHIPRRRLKPVDPSTSPAVSSLFKRQNPHPYRDDNDLEYEDVDNLLYDLLRLMLVKNPERRIRLRDIKRHPWVVQGIPNILAWLDDTDPARPSCGRRIQVDEKDMSFAVVPLKFLERARSAMKKAVGKVMHPLADRGDSRSRRRAASSVASTAGDSLFRHAGPPTHLAANDRRSSFRVDDYFSPHVQPPKDLKPAPFHAEPVVLGAVGARPETVAYDPLATVLPPPEKSLAKALAKPRGSSATELDVAAREMMHPGCSRRFHRHAGHSQLSHLLRLAPTQPPETQSTPATPRLEGRHAEDRFVGDATGRTARGDESRGEESTRSSSADRALFTSADKRSHAEVGLSIATTPGSIHPPRHGSRPVRSVDLGRGKCMYSPGGTLSPLSCSPITSTARQLAPSPAEDGVDAHRPSSAEESATPAHPSAHAPAAEPPERAPPCSAETEGGAVVGPAVIPCPASPGARDATAMAKSSSMESVEGTGTPLTSPSEATSPVAVDAPPKQASQSMLVIQSDPSLPALLSGSSSVSADIEGELLGRPGVVTGGPRRLDADAPPPAMAKAAAGMAQSFGKLPTTNSGSLKLRIEPDAPEVESADTLEPDSRLADDDDDDGSDDGILLMAKARQRTPILPKGLPLSFESKRRDTDASIASNETAKKIPIPDGGAAL
ncbi:hypothetical protein RJ55_06721 [Drechmeria coniospora]|nr:hypothetical protein RJ55_06721 [Drechmeria coniospora]